MTRKLFLHNKNTVQHNKIQERKEKRGGKKRRKKDHKPAN